jgi:hypothetical protein
MADLLHRPRAEECMRLGVSQVWIVAGALVILGLGLMGGIVKTRQKDPAS